MQWQIRVFPSPNNGLPFPSLNPGCPQEVVSKPWRLTDPSSYRQVWEPHSLQLQGDGQVFSQVI